MSSLDTALRALKIVEGVLLEHEFRPEASAMLNLQIAQSCINAALQNPLADIAAATAHRACCGTEHDAASGKFHGYCIVCGVPWPCDTAKYFLRSLADNQGAKP